MGREAWVTESGWHNIFSLPIPMCFMCLAGRGWFCLDLRRRSQESMGAESHYSGSCSYLDGEGLRGGWVKVFGVVRSIGYLRVGRGQMVNARECIVFMDLKAFLRLKYSTRVL